MIHAAGAFTALNPEMVQIAYAIGRRVDRLSGSDLDPAEWSKSISATNLIYRTQIDAGANAYYRDGIQNGSALPDDLIDMISENASHDDPGYEE
jgi:hypothetical protein